MVKRLSRTVKYDNLSSAIKVLNTRLSLNYSKTTTQFVGDYSNCHLQDTDGDSFKIWWTGISKDAATKENNLNCSWKLQWAIRVSDFGRSF